MENSIFVKGAREHNLKNIDVEIPRNKFVVITGLSGSGKSSLAFDTIFAEGQRRYMESLSSYARQFLGQLEKPDVDYIEGLSPAVSIDQKAVSKNPRSTVGTVTEIYDYLRVLYARIGKAYCPIDSKKIQQYSVDEISDLIFSTFTNKKIKIYAPIIRGRKGDYLSVLNEYFQKGFTEALIDDNKVELNSIKRLDRYRLHNIEILIDSFTLQKESNDMKLRLNEAIETASKEADGLINVRSQEELVKFSTKFSCPDGHIFEELEPRLFSFNSPFGACEECLGLGYMQEVDTGLIVPDENKTIEEGAILPWSFSQYNYYGAIIKSAAVQINAKTNIAFKNLTDTQKKYLIYGPDNEEMIPVSYLAHGRSRKFHMRFSGVLNLLEDRYENTDSDAVKEEIAKYMSKQKCDKCHGKRLKVEALSVKVASCTIDQVVSMPVEESLKHFENLDLTEDERFISDRLLKEITSRLRFLSDVGLNYLSLDRYASTLSGGETQRIRLASQIGSGLVGVLYVLDEPSIGLHQRDNKRLLETLKNLRNLGNSVIVIEHDEETIREADHIIDVGPGAGLNGGEIVAQGSIEDICNSKESLTGAYLRGERSVPVNKNRRKISGKYISISNATENNLKNINVKFPLGMFVCVTGVSGSGKSTLVNDVLYLGLAREVGKSWKKPGKFEKIEGFENIDKIIDIDQSPIGRTPRSNPATYTKSFDLIRTLFSSTEEARLRGYKPGRFSFNVTGGRCEKCLGDGFLRIEMHFLPDVFIPCDVCKGKRYNHETLEVKYKGRNISEVLNLSVDEAYDFFKDIPSLSDKLKVMKEVGLGYVKLGQSATTLSGGEAQRIKLSSELSKRATGKTMYILDEPTTGLHFEDVSKLLEVLNRLVDQENTVVVIEHNLDVIKTADYIIDLGPEGGEKGGKVIAAGSPELISGIKNSQTGKFLKEVLDKDNSKR